MTAFCIIPSNKSRRTKVEYASTIGELEEITEAYDKAGWDLIAMTQKAGYTMVFKRKELR